jgi:hypothetical protein
MYSLGTISSILQKEEEALGQCLGSCNGGEYMWQGRMAVLGSTGSKKHVPDLLVVACTCPRITNAAS